MNGLGTNAGIELFKEGGDGDVVGRGRSGIYDVDAASRCRETSIAPRVAQAPLSFQHLELQIICDADITQDAKSTHEPLIYKVITATVVI